MIYLIIGWMGTALYLLNHAVYSVHSNYSLRKYYIFNFLAALFVTINSVYLLSYQPVVTNVYWMVVSILGFLSFEEYPRVYPKRVFYGLGAILICASVALWAYGQFTAFELMGWLSVFVYCSSYFLLVTEKFSRREYQIGSFIAAVLIIPSLFLKQNWPMVVLEVAWAALSFYSVIRTNSNRKIGEII